ncbi:Art7 [Symbiodinium natans]|uniref:Art7 protein n=1 Tax=Symbiodinium natans TaxID=878477 RepID=A0A812HWR3_9DINO|nr:Art7 [Symbiodinium natans]
MPGEAHGVALWFDAELFGSIRLSTSPEQPLREHWRQAALCFRSPIEAGSEPLELEAHHDDDAVWITLPRRPSEKLQPGRPPACSCGLHAATSRRRLGALGGLGTLRAQVEKEGGALGGALVLGDGPNLAIRLARIGYCPVVSVGPGMLNASIIQKFATSNGLQGVLKAALRDGDIVPKAAEATRKRRLEADVRFTGWESEADSREEDVEDFLWENLAKSLAEACDADWTAFSEPWYDSMAEDWGFHHYALFARHLHALKRASVQVQVAAPGSWTLCAAAFESEWLARRLRPLPSDLAPWEGIDLRALNTLHAGQPSSGFSIDVFPLVSNKMLQVVSQSVEVMHLPCTWESQLEAWHSVELSLQRPAHGILRPPPPSERKARTGADCDCCIFFYR